MNWKPLDRVSFAPFGDVIESAAGTAVSINEGTTVRHDDLAHIDVGTDSGRPIVSIFESRPFGFPLKIEMLERHPLGSQAFVPLDGKPFLIVVAPKGDVVEVTDVEVFLARAGQGINFHRGVWHHPVIVIEPARFLVIDRGGDEENCDIWHFPSDGPEMVLERPS
ncbi:MAG: ureidoglycolate lyase [Rhodospirillales bacterium]|nr:ureidoglycolate lyase [Rhodospirillales bacterium]